MPLSDEELRLLEQMERELAAEDPKFVATLRGRSLRRTTRLRLVLAGVAFVAGVALMMAGAMARMTWLGIVGFLVMLASATLGLAAWRGHHPPPEPSQEDTVFGLEEQHAFRVIDGGRKPRKPRKTKHTSHGTFMQRMEQRWQHRREQGF